MGCGTGHLVRRSARISRGRVEGVDPSAAMVARGPPARPRRAVRGRARGGARVRRRVRRRRVQLGLAVVPGSALGVARMRAALRPGGRLGLQAPARSRLRAQLRRGHARGRDASGHRRRRSRASRAPGSSSRRPRSTRRSSGGPGSSLRSGGDRPDAEPRARPRRRWRSSSPPRWRRTSAPLVTTSRSMSGTCGACARNRAGRVRAAGGRGRPARARHPPPVRDRGSMTPRGGAAWREASSPGAGGPALRAAAHAIGRALGNIDGSVETGALVEACPWGGARPSRSASRRSTHQHEELFRRAEQLVRALRTGDRAGVDALFTYLAGYVEKHFLVEERLMGRAGYPGLDAHRSAHARFRAELEAHLRAYAADGGNAGGGPRAPQLALRLAARAPGRARSGARTVPVPRR